MLAASLEGAAAGQNGELSDIGMSKKNCQETKDADPDYTRVVVSDLVSATVRLVVFRYSSMRMARCML